MWVRLGSFPRVEHLSGATLAGYGYTCKLGYKVMSGTNTPGLSNEYMQVRTRTYPRRQYLKVATLLKDHALWLFYTMAKITRSYWVLKNRKIYLASKKLKAIFTIV